MLRRVAHGVNRLEIRPIKRRWINVSENYRAFPCGLVAAQGVDRYFAVEAADPTRSAAGFGQGDGLVRARNFVCCGCCLSKFCSKQLR
jgi:hypothetical protein